MDLPSSAFKNKNDITVKGSINFTTLSRIVVSEALLLYTREDHPRTSSSNDDCSILFHVSPKHSILTTHSQHHTPNSCAPPPPQRQTPSWCSAWETAGAPTMTPLPISPSPWSFPSSLPHPLGVGADRFCRLLHDLSNGYSRNPKQARRRLHPHSFLSRPHSHPMVLHQVHIFRSGRCRHATRWISSLR